MEKENLKEEFDSKSLSSADASTDAGDKRKSLGSAWNGRRSTDSKSEWTLFEDSITPKTAFFVKPNESPEYELLNSRLQELYEKLNCEIEQTSIGEMTEKVVKVLNTQCSSLLLRRNKSEKKMVIVRN